MESETNNGAPARPASQPCREYAERMYLFEAEELERCLLYTSDVYKRQGEYARR